MTGDIVLYYSKTIKKTNNDIPIAEIVSKSAMQQEETIQVEPNIKTNEESAKQQLKQFNTSKYIPQDSKKPIAILKRDQSSFIETKCKFSKWQVRKQNQVLLTSLINFQQQHGRTTKQEKFQLVKVYQIKKYHLKRRSNSNS